MPSWNVVRTGLIAALAATALTTCVAVPDGDVAFSTVAPALTAAVITSGASAGVAIGLPREAQPEKLAVSEAPVAAPELVANAPRLAPPPLEGEGVEGALGVGDGAAPGAVAGMGDVELVPGADPGTGGPGVATLQPRIRLTGAPEAGTDPAELARTTPGVTFATDILVGQVAVAGAAGPEAMSVAAVDPEAFRVLTPQVTAEASAVWERVSEGDAAFTHDAGRRLQVALGQRVPAAEGGASIRVGAYASNGVPPVADAIVSTATGGELGLVGEPSVLVALAPEQDPATVATELQAVTGLAAEVIAQPTARQAFLTGADARSAFEPFNYIDNGDGMIQIDPDWVSRNIVRTRVPILTGEVVCHRLLIPQLRGALGEIEALGLAPLIDVTDYGGCWVPRHIDFNPSKPLSMHGWGLAVDINVQTNGLGATPTLDPRIVEVFDRWGFVWGGRWRRPDGMHFELGALLQSPQG